MDTPAQRLQKIAEYKGLTLSALSSECGNKRPQGFYDIRDGKAKTISERVAEQILSVYPEINRTWLLTGEGEMLSSDAPSLSLSEEESASLTPRNALSYYPDILAYAGNVNFFTDDDSNRAILLKVPGYEGCIGVKVYGDSMEPTAYAGNIVAIEREPVHNIVNGEIYFVVTKEQRFIKRLTQSYDDNGYPRPSILCTSDNPDQRTYAPFYIHAGDVVAIHLVVGFISMKLYR